MMLKSYIDELVEWVEFCVVKKCWCDEVVVVFLVVRVDVEVVLVFGYVFVIIWEYMWEMGKVKFFYEMFCLYVRWYIKVKFVDVFVL